MSNIASPRPSLSIRSPSVVSSTRTSLDIPTSSPVSALRAGNTNRRNRAALRDYYNLKSSAPADATTSNTEVVEKGPLHELDAPNFEAGAFVKGLLEKEGLEGILKVESMLVGQIKGLDGERKALVYDNYSRLIQAAETIQKVRDKLSSHAAMPVRRRTTCSRSVVAYEFADIVVLLLLNRCAQTSTL